MTIVEFLTARLDEDEAVAREAMVVIGDDLTEYRIAEWWEKPEHGRVYAGHWHKVAQAGVTSGESEFHNTAALPHIVRHNPARVFADVAAKRALVAEHTPDSQLCYWTNEGGSVCHRDAIEWGAGPCTTLRILASVYADHPDYREEWRPLRRGELA